MQLFKHIAGLSQILMEARQSGKTIGFVPTMGALHQGHISLIKRAAAENDLVVCSIFVNPTQFNQQSDLDKYPKTLANDILLLEDAGCHLLFHPEVSEMYPEGIIAQVRNFGLLTTLFEGAFRPGHFDGVAEIVKKLFAIVQPTTAYFGLKDYQQCMVVEALVREDQIPVKLVFCETQRDADGLALSSRNRRLSDTQRETALLIPQTLFWIKQNYRQQDLNVLLNEARHKLEPAIKIEYIDIVNQKTLLPLTTSSEDAVVLFAGWCGEVRLIDNMLLSD